MTLVVAAATLALKPLAMTMAVPRFSVPGVAVHAPARVAVTEPEVLTVSTSPTPSLPRSLIVSVPVTMNVSLPAPPVMVFVPSPPLNVFAEALPSTVSAPLPPVAFSMIAPKAMETFPIPPPILERAPWFKSMACAWLNPEQSRMSVPPPSQMQSAGITPAVNVYVAPSPLLKPYVVLAARVVKLVPYICCSS